MPKPQSVVSLDPIDRTGKKANSPISRLLKTRWYKGKPMAKTDEFGHYLFVGKQRQGKTTSMIWYYQFLTEKYKKKGYKIHTASNMGFGHHFERSQFSDLINKIQYSPCDVYFFLVDEIQSWYPKDTKNKILLDEIDRLTGDFSQLGKRQIYVLSTAQVYGRLNKNLREQCLYMINCKPSFFKHKCVNDFILGDDVMCDDLGRWSGVPVRILVHGVPTLKFDTHAMIQSR